MKKGLIVPTINVPVVLRDWAAMMTPDEDFIIVAGGGGMGDDKPHEQIEDLMDEIRDEFKIMARYIRPEDQRHWRCSESMGWFSTTRRNIALLEALKEKPELIITIDDDNAPKYENQLELIDTYFADDFIGARGVSSSGGWANPCELMAAKNGWNETYEVLHRGFPLSQRFVYQSHKYDVVEARNTLGEPVGVFEMLWTGEPDIDALDRIASHPLVDSVDPHPLKLMPYTWAPFDSQSTVYRASLAPLMMCWPGVGRYDDIWASYVSRHVMDHLGYSALYGYPDVHQDRNEHDLLKDLQAEMFGMRYNDQMIEIIKNADLNGFLQSIDPENETVTEDKLVLQMLEMMYKHIDHEADFLNEQTRRGFTTWLADIESVINE